MASYSSNDITPKESYPAIEQLLPHRSPFLFVDSLKAVNEKQATAVHTFHSDHGFFAGHFPSYPVVPGVLLIETMAQAGGAAVAAQELLPPGSLFLLATIEKAKFRKEVRPGDEAVIEVHNDRISAHMIRQSGTITVDGELACEASWMCIVQKQSEEEQ